MLHSPQWHGPVIDFTESDDSKRNMAVQSAKSVKYSIQRILNDMIRSHTDQGHSGIDHNWRLRTSYHPTHRPHSTEACLFSDFGKALPAATKLHHILHAHCQPRYDTPRRNTTMNDWWVCNDYELLSYWSTAMSLHYWRDCIDRNGNKILRYGL